MYKIAIDLDNCLNNLTEALLQLYNLDANDHLTMNDITEYKIDGFVKNDWKDSIKYYFIDNSVWSHVKAISGSQEIVKQLLSEGNDVYIATSSHLYDMPTKYNWLKRNFPFIKKDKIITIFNKQLLDVDFLIDDYEGNLIGGKYKKILLDYPWNRQVDEEKNEIIRCKDFFEIYQIINKKPPCNKDCFNCIQSGYKNGMLFCEKYNSWVVREW